MKQTAVEWLMEIDKSRAITIEEWQQAREMEKVQMIEFARNIIIDATCSVEGYVTTEKDIEEYYNETFNTNG
jgi:hypothetical protein